MPALNHVVLLDKIDLSARDILKASNVQVDVFEKFTEIPEASLASVDGLIVRSATKVTADVMSKCPSLKIIGRAGTGVDNIDVPTATSKGIVVMNTPGGNTISAAEHTCFMIMAMARNAANNNATMKTHKWSKSAGQELMGKTLGIVGLGRIGLEVASRMQAFGMTTIGFDPIVAPEAVAPLNVRWVTLDEMWPLVDYVTVHTPLIPQTKDLVCEKSLNLCKKGVKIVNVARGGIVNEKELLDALNNGQCGGAGLDVFVEEPPTSWDLVDHPNVTATAHLGASTKEGQLKCGQEIANQFVDFSNNASQLVGVINSPALVASFSETTAPWLKLGTALAQVLSALSAKSLSGEWKVEALGTGYPSNLGKFITAAVASGALKSTNPTANLINGASLAATNGVNVSFTATESSGDATPQLRITKDGHSVRGSLTGLVELEGAVLPEPFSLELSSGTLFVGSVAQANLGSVVTKMQSAGLRRVNFAPSGSNVLVVGVSGNQVSELEAEGLNFANL